MAARTLGIRNVGLVVAAAAVPVIIALATKKTPPGPAAGPVVPNDVKPATCSVVSSIQDCHARFPTGCTSAAKPKYDAYLNLIKNQVPDAESLNDPANLDENDFNDLDKRTPATLSTHNHADFADELKEMGEGTIRSVVAFLYFSKANPGESSNCQLPTRDDADFHVLLGFNADLAKEAMAARAHVTLPTELKDRVDHAAVIMEITPFVRQEQHHDGWTLKALQKHWGEPVKVVGQLMVDNEHNIQDDNCALVPKKDVPTSDCWRRTAWEIHPVMQFFVCNDGASCTADSDAGWLPLDNAK